MKGISIGAIASFLLIMVCSAEASDGTQADKLTEIMKRGKMIIATSDDYPPQSELIKGVKRGSDTKCFSNEYVSEEFTGFDIDVAKEVAKRMGVEPCFVAPPWIEIINGGWADRWDIAFAFITITSERMETLYFPQPYFSAPVFFYVHKDNTKLFSGAPDCQAGS